MTCPHCHSALPGTLCNTGAPVHCPACDSRIQVEIFPALFNSTGTGPAAEAILEEGISSCFFHEQKKAVVSCGGCGRFLCSLCDLELNGEHLCPRCLHSGAEKGRRPELETRRAIYDSAALSTALLPLMMWPVTLVTAPVAIYLAILSFLRPSSLIPRTRIRAYLALAFALLELGGWAALFFSMMQRA
jgi:hypothetical protein